MYLFLEITLSFPNYYIPCAVQNSGEHSFDLDLIFLASFVHLTLCFGYKTTFHFKLDKSSIISWIFNIIMDFSKKKKSNIISSFFLINESSLLYNYFTDILQKKNTLQIFLYNLKACLFVFSLVSFLEKINPTGNLKWIGP